MAEEYMRLHPRGSAVVTQFQSRPEILVRVEKTHRPTTMSFAEAIFSATMPRPSAESIRWFPFIWILFISQPLMVRL